MRSLWDVADWREWAGRHRSRRVLPHRTSPSIGAQPSPGPSSQAEPRHRIPLHPPATDVTFGSSMNRGWRKGPSLWLSRVMAVLAVIYPLALYVWLTVWERRETFSPLAILSIVFSLILGWLGALLWQPRPPVVKFFISGKEQRACPSDAGRGKGHSDGVSSPPSMSSWTGRITQPHINGVESSSRFELGND